MSKLSPFDFVNSLNSREKPDLIGDDIESEKAYNAFIINRQFSYFPDTIFLANELNSKHHIPVKAQYEFYRNTIRPRKRWAKWHKAIVDENINVVSKYYGISKKVASSSVDLLAFDELSRMKEELSPGGRQTNK